MKLLIAESRFDGPRFVLFGQFQRLKKRELDMQGELE